MKNLESLFAAFVAFWAIFFVYQITLSRRLARLESDLAGLQETLAPGGRR